MINGTDLKAMLKSDVLLTLGNLETVNEIFDTVFAQWHAQVNQGGFNAALEYNGNVDTVWTGNLTHAGQAGIFDAWEDIFAPYLKYYGLFMTSRVDLVNKKVIFTVGKSMYQDLNVKLWEHGIYDYGKWVASINETQGVVLRQDTGAYTHGARWILRSNNVVTNNTALRDIYPVKRKLILKEAKDGTEETAKMNEASTEALEALCEGMFNENIEISGMHADFETRFNVYPQRGGGYTNHCLVGSCTMTQADLQRCKSDIGSRDCNLFYKGDLWELDLFVSRAKHQT